MEESTSSLNAFTASNGNTSLNSYTTSTNTRLTRIEESTASLNTYTASLATTFEARASATHILVSGSSQIDVFATTNSGRIATTGSNTYVGNQIISGSTYITGDLVVYGSASVTMISSSAINIGTNTIELNTATPSVRFAGISVHDSGSGANVTGSLWWDSFNNNWIYQHETGGTYSGGMLISGPRNTGNLGDEVGVTANRLTVGMGGDHISSSNIYNDNTTTGFSQNVEVTGSLVVGSGITGQIKATNGVISGSSQINFTGISGLSANIISASTDTSNVDMIINGGSISANLYGGVVSGSSQINYTQLSGISANIVSGSTNSTNVNFTTSNGSITANLIGGVVSGSSQVSYTGLSNIPSGIVSSSAQIDALFNIDGVVSGSSQINYTQLSGISANIISASSNTTSIIHTISGGSISAYAAGGIVSGSTQITPLLPTGVVSGSIQVLGSSTVLSGSNQTYISTINQSLGTTSTAVQFATLGVGTAPDATYEFKVAGDIAASGDIVAYNSSDRRLKNNITPIENALDKVNKMGGYEFDWNEELQKARKGHDIGVIAQEVQSIVPEVVVERESGFLAVDYEKLVPVLIEAIKELSAKVKELESK